MQDENIEIELPVEDQEPDVEAGDELDNQAEESTDQESQEAEGDIVVTIGDEEPEEDAEEVSKAPQWVRDLRKSDREKTRRIKELEAQIGQKSATEQPLQLGPKPTLADCEFDEDAYAQKLEQWYVQKSAVEAAQEKAKEAEQQAQAQWQAKVDGYTKAKAEIKVKDYDEAESVAQEFLSPTQQGIIVSGADNPALVVYALGKNPTKARELAAIADPIQFTYAVAKLEAKLKMTTRKPPAPERTVGSSGGAPSSGAIDSTLERLRKEAEKTGDYTKVMQYKNSKRRA